MEKTNEPRIALILEKDGKKVYMYPSYRKALIFARNKAKDLLKDGSTITIRVNYGKGLNAFGKMVTFYNSGTYTTREDLLWALDAFVKEYM